MSLLEKRLQILLDDDRYRRVQAAAERRGCSVATALEAGFTSIVTSDSDFDQVPGLARIDLASWAEAR